MKSRDRIYFILLSASLFMLSCDDIFEPDISNEQVSLLSPPDSFQTGVYSQTFWWEILEGATHYNLQIVIPDFSSIQRLIVDTNITSDKFSISIPPGNYQWRVKALNSTSETEYQTRTLIVDSLLDMSLQTIVLVSPNVNLVTNTDVLSFQWNYLYGATGYEFRLQTVSGHLLIDTSLSVNQFEVVTQEGEFTWCVVAFNSVSATTQSCRNFEIDLTAPAFPVHTYPLFADTLTDSLIVFTWISDTQSIGDSLFIFSDSLQNNLLFSGVFSGNSYSFVPTTNSTYYWKLSSIDLANNWSGYSSLWRFFVN